jgi:hypothetical protein
MLREVNRRKNAFKESTLVMKADDWNNSEARCSMSYNRKFYRDFDIKESLAYTGREAGNTSA